MSAVPEVSQFQCPSLAVVQGSAIRCQTSVAMSFSTIQRGRSDSDMCSGSCVLYGRRDGEPITMVVLLLYVNGIQACVRACESYTSINQGDGLGVGPVGEDGALNFSSGENVRRERRGAVVCEEAPS